MKNVAQSSQDPSSRADRSGLESCQHGYGEKIDENRTSQIQFFKSSSTQGFNFSRRVPSASAAASWTASCLCVGTVARAGGSARKSEGS